MRGCLRSVTITQGQVNYETVVSGVGDTKQMGYRWSMRASGKRVVEYVLDQLCMNDGKGRRGPWRPKVVMVQSIKGYTGTGMFISIVTNYTIDKMPSKRDIERFQDFVGFTDEPRWYPDQWEYVWRV